MIKKTALVLALALSSGSGQAQFLVSDPAILANDIVGHAETILKWIEQARKLQEMWEEAQKTQQALRGVRDIRDAFQSPVLRQFMSKDLKAAYAAFRRDGYIGLAGKGVDIYRENEVADGDTCSVLTDTDERMNCESTASQNAQIMGDNLDTIDSINEKGTEIAELLEKAQSSQDMKESADINNRIQILQAEQEQLAQTIIVRNQLAQAQKGLNQDRARQLHSKQFSNTKGIEVEVPEFNFGE